MTDQDLMAKQSAIIQAQEIELKELKDNIATMREREYYHMQYDMQRNVFQYQSKEMENLSIKMLENRIKSLQYKLNKKRPRFIMIINKWKRKNGNK